MRLLSDSWWRSVLMRMVLSLGVSRVRWMRSGALRFLGEWNLLVSVLATY